MKSKNQKSRHRRFNDPRMRLNIKPESESQNEYIGSVYLNTGQSKHKAFNFHPSIFDTKAAYSPINTPLKKFSKDPFFGMLINSPYKSKKSFGLLDNLDNLDKISEIDGRGSNNFVPDDMRSTRNMFVESPYITSNQNILISNYALTPKLEPLHKTNFQFIDSVDKSLQKNNIFFRNPIPPPPETHSNQNRFACFDARPKSPMPVPQMGLLHYSIYNNEPLGHFSHESEYDFDVIDTLIRGIQLQPDKFGAFQYTMFKPEVDVREIFNAILNGKLPPGLKRGERVETLMSRQAKSAGQFAATAPNDLFTAGRQARRGRAPRAAVKAFVSTRETKNLIYSI